jgi:hypothetical protein
MFRTFPIAVAWVVLAGCGGGRGDAMSSTPLDTPTRDFEVIPPEVDTGWPLREDTDTDASDTDEADDTDT